MSAVLSGALAVAAAVLALAVAGLAALAVRRRLLQRGGATFDCSLREGGQPDGRGWTPGVARYAGDVVEWYRVFSYSPRPRRRVARHELHIVDRRPAQGGEADLLLSGAVVLHCRWAGRPLDLGMTEPALTGFLAWLEAAPPGRGLDVA